MKKYEKPTIETLCIDVKCDNVLAASYVNRDDDWGVQDGFID